MVRGAWGSYNETGGRPLEGLFVTDIPITRPSFDAEEERRVCEVLRSGWVAQGPVVDEFEGAFARLCGARHAVAVSSGTTALHLALLVIGIGPGDEVLVPSFTWVATANAVRYCGARPILCDIDLRTFNIDVRDAARRCTPQTQAIIPVHQFGLPADMDAVDALAADRGLQVVADAACAFGAAYRDRPVGRLAPIETFSFHPRKSITTGEGGMLLTESADTAARLRSLRSHGPALEPVAPPTPEWGESLLGDIDVLGYNYRLTDLQAGVGLAQLGKAEALLAARRAHAAAYDRALEGVQWLLRPAVPEHARHAYQSYTVLMAGPGGALPTLADLPALNARRNAILAHLDREGIATRQGTHAVHLLSVYAAADGVAPDALPGALLADRLSFSLPLYPALTAGERTRVVDTLQAAYTATA